jgi:Papain-like cysteine protease AvrRpt2
MALTVATGIPLLTPGKVWPVPSYSQEATEWCWLACAQMVGDMQPRSARLQQCQLAHGGSQATIQQIYTDYALGFIPTPVVGQPAESDLVAWLARGPIQVFWTTPDQAHVALIVGVQQLARGKYKYTVNDPWPVGSGQVRPLAYDQLLPTIHSGYDWSWQCVWHF